MTGSPNEMRLPRRTIGLQTRFVAAMNPVIHSFRTIKKLARVATGHEIWQLRQLRADRLTLGADHADWTIHRPPLRPESVIYSMGVGEDISFDLEMIRRCGATVHAFDPTPRSIAWVKRQALPAEFVFHPFGVGEVDGTCSFSPPRDPQHVSHSLVHRDTTRPAIDVPIYRLATIARMLGHPHIDLLKMDIEGSEYGVIDDLVSSQISVGQLLVEFHHRWPEVGLNRTRQAIRQLNDAGYKIFHVSASGDEYSFLKVDPN